MQDIDLTRFSRQLMLPGFGLEGQKLLHGSSVVILGLGGLGCPVSTYLAAAGVGRLILVDYDRVELTNLHRQVLYTPSDIGLSKVEAAASRLKALNSAVALTKVERRLQFGDLWFEELLAKADVVVDGSDNFSARYAVNHAAVKTNTPLCYGSVYRYGGEVSTFVADGGPCYACLHPVPPLDGTVPSCAEGGVLGVAPGLVGMLQATEVLKLLAGFAPPLKGRLVSIDFKRNPSFREWRLKRRPDCYECGEGVGRVQLQLDESARLAIKPVPEVDLSSYRREYEGQGLLLIDIRSKEELVFGALKGAIHLHGSALDEFIAEGPRPVVFCCKSGGRSKKLVSRLAAQGWNQAYSLSGGWDEWMKAGEPLVAY